MGGKRASHGVLLHQEPTHQGSAPAHPRPNEGSMDEAVGWPVAMWVVLGSMMGVGLLALPAAFQRLGWLPAVACICLVAAAAAYAGVQYARVMAEAPWLSSFHELGARAAGRAGVVLVACTAYLAIFTVPAVLHLACTQALQQLFEASARPPLLLSGFAIALAMMPLAQLRRLADVGWLGALGSCSMCGAMVLLVVKLLLLEPPQPDGAETHLVEHTSLLPACVGIMDIIFALSGQINWPRFAAAMGPHRRQFNLSTGVALTVMTPTVLAVGAVGYVVKGGTINLTDPITMQLEPDRYTQMINVGILVSVMVAYVLDVNVAAQVFLEMVHPQKFKPIGHGHTIGSHIPSVGSHIRSHHLHAPHGGLSEPLLDQHPAGPDAHQQQDWPPHSRRPDPRDSPYAPPPMQIGISAQQTSASQAPQAQAAPLAAAPTHTHVGSLQQQPQQPLPSQQQQQPQPQQLPGTSRTVSEAERALGTGVVLQSMAQELQSQPAPWLHAQEAAQPQADTQLQPQAPPQQEADSAFAPLPITVLLSPTSSSAEHPAAPSSAALAGADVAKDSSTGMPHAKRHARRHHASHHTHDTDEEVAGQGMQAGRASHHLHPRHEHEDVEGGVEHSRNDIGTVRMLWGITTISLVLIAWMVGHIWPNFAQLEGIIASIGGVSSIFLLPNLFALRILRLPAHERVLCWLLCGSSLVMTGLGLYASIQQMHRAEGSGCE